MRSAPMTEDHFLRAIFENPASAAATWLVLADWLVGHLPCV